MYKYKSLQAGQLPQEHLPFLQNLLNYIITKYLKQDRINSRNKSHFVRFFESFDHNSSKIFNQVMKLEHSKL